MKAWIDIENPPQVQYLSPLKTALETRGYEVFVTACDRGLTLDLLDARGIVPHVVGTETGRAKVRKIARLTRRAIELSRLFRSRGRPDLVVAASRSSDLAARTLGIPSFQFTDYEHADDRVSRLTRSYLLFPDVIDQGVFLSKGLKPDRLVPFPGLKEEISFAGIDVEQVEPYPLPTLDTNDLVKVLFRAPGENTHYFARDSLALALEGLAVLAARKDLALIYVPRYSAQIDYLDRFAWATAPHVISRGVPFVSLLKTADLVISSGGTMLREAAFLGLPAYSILRSAIGQVDYYLESLGRLTLLESVGDLARIHFKTRAGLDPLATGSDLIDTLVDRIIARARSPVGEVRSLTG